MRDGCNTEAHRPAAGGTQAAAGTASTTALPRLRLLFQSSNLFQFSNLVLFAWTYLIRAAAGSGATFAGVGFDYSGSGSPPCDGTGNCAVNLACDLFVTSGGCWACMPCALCSPQLECRWGSSPAQVALKFRHPPLKSCHSPLCGSWPAHCVCPTGSGVSSPTTASARVRGWMHSKHREPAANLCAAALSAHLASARCCSRHLCAAVPVAQHGWPHAALPLW